MNLRVLVVDDSSTMRRIIVNVLTQLGISTDFIHEAEDGFAALGKVKTNSYDVILTDWNMPRMNGLQFVQNVRKLPKYTTTPILMITTEGGKSEVIEALKVANAWEFVETLPNGIETNIGDSGNKLSGGQKQRLSIARAVLKSPPIMILDEATSALDTESERLVQIALENMMKNRTSIVIAHRLSTIQKADEIVVLNKGEIVEKGKHDELIAQKGIYQKLVEMQSI